MSTGIEGLLKRVSRIEGEIADLQGRVVAKQRERQALINEAKAALNALGPNKSGVGRGNHDSRRGPQKGTPNTKQRSLTSAQVRKMRAEWATGEFSQRELGEKYGLAQPVVNSIVHRKTYQDVA